MCVGDGEGQAHKERQPVLSLLAGCMERESGKVRNVNLGTVRPVTGAVRLVTFEKLENKRYMGAKSIFL